MYSITLPPLIVPTPEGKLCLQRSEVAASLDMVRFLSQSEGLQEDLP